MNTSMAGSALLAAVLLGGASGCIDFDQEGTYFCQHYPERCHQGSSNADGGTVTPDAGETNAQGTPEIVGVHQSATSTLTQGSITLRITLRDANNSPLRFSWQADIGTLEAPTNTETTSEVVWKAPACVPEGRLPEVTVSVTNALNLSASRKFIVSTTPCVAQAAGNDLSLRLNSGGTVWAWGYNTSGQVGDGTTTDRAAPVRVNGLSGVMKVSAGNHSLALRGDGTVWTWGANGYGQLGDGTTTDRSTPVQVSGLSSSMVAVSAGGKHSLVLSGDGAVWAWGYNNDGQLGDGTATHRSTPVQVNGLSGVVTVSAGSNHSLALSSDGTVWAWGYNTSGQVGDGTINSHSMPVRVNGLSGVVAIWAGSEHSLAVRSDGTVWAWGYNNEGQLGDGTTTDRSTPIQVNGLSGVVAVSAGGQHSLALRGDGTVWAWGKNAFGQLGDGTTTHHSTPVQVSGLSGVVAIAAGTRHSLAVRGDGGMWAWGSNAFGQLGDGTTTHRSTPVQVSSFFSDGFESGSQGIENRQP